MKPSNRLDPPLSLHCSSQYRYCTLRLFIFVTWVGLSRAVSFRHKIRACFFCSNSAGHTCHNIFSVKSIDTLIKLGAT